jgi:hypothetical protein
MKRFHGPWPTDRPISLFDNSGHFLACWIHVPAAPRQSQRGKTFRWPFPAAESLPIFRLPSSLFILPA